MADDPRDAQLLRAAFDASTQAVVIIDRHHRIVVTNARSLEVFGRPPDELVGQDFAALVPEWPHGRDDAQQAGDGEAATLRTGQPLEFEALRSDGTTLPVEIWLSALEIGGDSFVLAMVRDRTQHQSEQERFRSLLNAAPDATVIVDQTATIVLVNDQVEHVFGYQREELIGQKIEVLVPLRFRDGHPARRDGFLADPVVRPMGIGLDLYAVRRDGSEFPVEISLSPLKTEQGVLVSAAVRDVSERKRIEAETDRLREELIATVSHELRTPLTSIIGYTELMADLDDEDLGPVARRMLAVIDRNARRELRLVDDLLTVAFLGDRRLPVQLVPVDLVKVARDGVEAAQTLAAAHDVSLHMHGPPVPWVSGDAHRLGQVVDNLLTNAIKFTGAGGRVDVRVSQDGGKAVVLEVADTGSGMTDAELERIFDRLYRTASAVQNHVAGVGLGLSIVQAIVEAHAGSVQAESALGGGSVFSVRLPAAEEAQPGDSGDPPVQRGGSAS